MTFHNTAQQAIFTALDGNITGSVYDAPPGTPAGLPDNAFPYTVIGDDTAVAYDTDDRTGQEFTITLHTWSRYDGAKQCKTILGEIYDELHRATLSATDYYFRDCQVEFQDVVREDDGKLRHGVTRVRVWLQEDTWILSTGSWNDAARWVDRRSWDDGA